MRVVGTVTHWIGFQFVNNFATVLFQIGQVQIWLAHTVSSTKGDEDRLIIRMANLLWIRAVLGSSDRGMTILDPSRPAASDELKSAQETGRKFHDSLVIESSTLLRYLAKYLGKIAWERQARSRRNDVCGSHSFKTQLPIFGGRLPEEQKLTEIHFQPLSWSISQMVGSSVGTMLSVRMLVF